MGLFAAVSDFGIRAFVQQALNWANQAAASAASANALVTGVSTARSSIRPSLLLDFANSDVLDPRITYTRNDTAKSYFDRNGVMRIAKANEWPREFDAATGRCLGRSVWESRTNVALWSRDLTNAAWVKSNTTAALTQIGVDGVANSASLLTATAANGTALQTVTLASSARFQTAYVRRVTGTGTINMTTDGGSTWTAVTLTSTWTRVSIPTQTLANPQLGFRIVTSGDAIAVDYVQNENGTFATPAIPTTTLAVTRAADLPSITGVNFTDFYNPAEGTIYAEALSLNIKPLGNNRLWGFSDGGLNNVISIFRNNTTPLGSVQIITAGSAQVLVPLIDNDGSNLIDINEEGRYVASWKKDDFASSRNGRTPETDASVTIPAVNQFWIGTLNNDGILFSWNGTITCIAYYPKRITNTELQALTTTGLLAGKSPNQLPSGSDLGTAAYMSAKALLTAKGRVEIPFEGTGVSRSTTIRRPYDFYFEITDATGVTVTASPSTSAVNAANTGHTLTFNAPTGTVLTIAIIPVIQ